MVDGRNNTVLIARRRNSITTSMVCIVANVLLTFKLYFIFASTCRRFYFNDCTFVIPNIMTYDWVLWQHWLSIHSKVEWSGDDIWFKHVRSETCESERIWIEWLLTVLSVLHIDNFATRQLLTCWHWTCWTVAQFSQVSFCMLCVSQTELKVKRSRGLDPMPMPWHRHRHSRPYIYIYR